MDKSQLAQALYDALVTDTRDNGETFIKLVEGAPEWMQSAIYKAHGEFLPEDIRYSMISECACKLTEYEPDQWEDCAFEMADSMVDIYNMDRLKWLASSLYRAAYCDEAQDNGLVSQDADMFTRIGIGQLQEYEEILHSLIRSIEDQAGHKTGEESDN